METDKLYLWATSRCALKEYCVSELRTKLTAKGANPEQVEDIVSRLQNEKYVDEGRYAQAFAADKFRFDHWGRIKISQALRLKGISPEAVQAALGTAIEEDEYRLSLLDFIQAKRRTTKAADSYALRQKVARSAISRGFEPHLVFAALSMDEEC